MKKLSVLDWIAVVILILAGLNDILMIFNFNLATSVLSGMSSAAMIIMIKHIWVGLSALYVAFVSVKLAKK